MLHNIFLTIGEDNVNFYLLGFCSSDCYKLFRGNYMSYEKKLLAQRKLEAKMRQARSDEKNRHVIKAGANLPSQWGKVVTNEQRLIDNGHFMKTSEGAKLDYMRERYRQAKKEAGLEKKLVLIKRV